MLGTRLPGTPYDTTRWCLDPKSAAHACPSHIHGPHTYTASTVLANKLRKSHLNTAKCVVITPSARMAVSGSDDGTLRVWRLLGGKLTHQGEGTEPLCWDRCMQIVQVGHSVEALVLSHDGQLLAAAAGGEVSTWVWKHASPPSETTNTDVTHQATGRSTAVQQPASGGSRPVSGGSGNPPAPSSTHPPGSQNAADSPGHGCTVSAVDVDEGGEGGGSRTGLRRAETADVALVPCGWKMSHPAPVLSLAMTREGGTLAVGCGDGCIYVWTLQAPPQCTPKLLRRVQGCDASAVGGVLSVVLVPEGRRRLLLCASTWGASPHVRCWDVGSGKQVSSMATELRNMVTTGDGRYLAASSQDYSGVCLWEAQELLQRPHSADKALRFRISPAFHTKFAFSADLSWLFVANGDGRMVRWRMALAAD